MYVCCFSFVRSDRKTKLCVSSACCGCWASHFLTFCSSFFFGWTNLETFYLLYIKRQVKWHLILERFFCISPKAFSQAFRMECDNKSWTKKKTMKKWAWSLCLRYMHLFASHGFVFHFDLSCLVPCRSIARQDKLHGISTKRYSMLEVQMVKSEHSKD